MIPAGARIQTVEDSPHRSGRASYFCSRYTSASTISSHIYRTDNYGETWTLLTDARTVSQSIIRTRVIREDPEQPGLFAGTELRRSCRSTRQRTGRPAKNPPNTPVTMKVHRNDPDQHDGTLPLWITNHAAATAGGNRHQRRDRPACDTTDDQARPFRRLRCSSRAKRCARNSTAGASAANPETQRARRSLISSAGAPGRHQARGHGRAGQTLRAWTRAQRPTAADARRGGGGG